MNNSTQNHFPGLLGLTFIVLKLTGYINWSWWWVLSPFWISGGIAFIVILVVGLIALLRKKK